MNMMRKGSFGGGLEAMLLRNRGVVGRGRSVQDLSALGILGCVTLCDKHILGTNWDKLSVVKLQLQLSLNKKYQDSHITSRQHLPLSREHHPPPQKGVLGPFLRVPIQAENSEEQTLGSGPLAGR